MADDLISRGVAADRVMQFTKRRREAATKLNSSGVASNTICGNLTMSVPFIVAAAQSVSVASDVQENVDRHLVFLREAAVRGSRMVVFPELSLTGTNGLSRTSWRSVMTIHVWRRSGMSAFDEG